MKKFFAVFAILAFVFAGISMTAPANAATRHCTVKVTKAYDEVVVDKPAYDETVHHAAVTHTETVPAVTHVVHHPAVVVHHAAVPSKWWVWAPSNTKGPQNYVPAFPVDARGKWIGPKTNGGPKPNATGTFQTGASGNSDWFHRAAAVPAYDEVVKPAYDETVVDVPAHTVTVVDKAAYDTVIHHAAVTHVVHHAAVKHKRCCYTTKHHAHKHHAHHKHHHAHKHHARKHHHKRHTRVVVVVCGCKDLTA